MTITNKLWAAAYIIILDIRVLVINIFDKNSNILLTWVNLAYEPVTSSLGKFDKRY